MSNTNTTAAAAAAFEAYREVNDLHPATNLSYEEASKHCHGDTLADFLVLELTEGVEGEDDAAAQYERGRTFLERAISDLEHVQTALADKQREQNDGASGS
jgi:hypothetical protein